MGPLRVGRAQIIMFIFITQNLYFQRQMNNKKSPRIIGGNCPIYVSFIFCSIQIRTEHSSEHPIQP